MTLAPRPPIAFDNLVGEAHHKIMIAQDDHGINIDVEVGFGSCVSRTCGLVGGRMSVCSRVRSCR